MQTSILQALALTVVGNAALSGRDVSDFWLEETLFRYSKVCDFHVIQSDGDRLIASDPMVWFATSQGECSGLRLHNAPRPLLPGQSIPIEARMLVGFVGGGPAWLIEAVRPGRSQLWQGYDRLGDRSDPQRKIWLHTYLMQSETASQDFSATPLRQTAQTLAPILTEIEALAKKIEASHFAKEFRRAARTLDGKDDAALPPYADFTRFANFDLERLRLLQALLSA